MVLRMVKKFYLVLNTSEGTIQNLGLSFDPEWWDRYYDIHGKFPSIKEEEEHEKERFVNIMKNIEIAIKNIKRYDSTNLTPLESLAAFEILLEDDIPYLSIEKIFKEYFGTTLPLWKNKPKLPRPKYKGDFTAYFPHR